MPRKKNLPASKSIVSPELLSEKELLNKDDSELSPDQLRIKRRLLWGHRPNKDNQFFYAHE